MKRTFTLSTFLIVIVILLVNTNSVNSKVNYAPEGAAGDPVTNQTCSKSGCHSGANFAVTGKVYLQTLLQMLLDWFSWSVPY